MSTRQQSRDGLGAPLRARRAAQRHARERVERRNVARLAATCVAVVLGITLGLGSAPTHAQTVSSTASAVAGWDPSAFPARTNRAYQRPPERIPISQRLRAYDPFFQEAAALYTLPVEYLRAVAIVESRLDPRVVSVDGAMGLMQLMPFTARRMGITEPFDPRQSILAGARFLRMLANQWQGDLLRTTASYNAGAGAVARYGGVPPFQETQRYVTRVLAIYRAQRLAGAPTQQRKPSKAATGGPS